MAEQVILPRLGQGMESGTIVRWLVSEGDKVEKGQPLYELDTDKVTQEVEADAGGVLLKIVVQEGEVPVGTAVGYVGEAGEDVPKPEPVSETDLSETEVPSEPEPRVSETEVSETVGEVRRQAFGPTNESINSTLLRRATEMLFHRFCFQSIPQKSRASQ